MRRRLRFFCCLKRKGGGGGSRASRDGRFFFFLLPSHFARFASSPVSAGAGADNAARPPATVNPWSLQCLRKLRDGPPEAPQPCILLEDLTSRFSTPCILDIKMGTRLHGPDVSAAKRAKAEAKSRATTSGDLGLRLCGMQVYDARDHTYKCQSKYVGRSLTPDTVAAAIGQFFALNNNGGLAAPRTQALIAGVVARLEALAAVVRQLDRFRFFSSSLLLIYDGDIRYGRGFLVARLAWQGERRSSWG